MTKQTTIKWYNCRAVVREWGSANGYLGELQNAASDCESSIRGQTEKERPQPSTVSADFHYRLGETLQLNRSTAVGRQRTSFEIRTFEQDDSNTICSWVRTRDALELVSGDVDDCLTKDILYSWLEKSEIAIVVSHEATDQPVGFCTLSCLETPSLPKEYVELCHLVVDPELRYFLIGSRLIRSGRLAARSLGFEFMCGRVVPKNRWALALVRHQRCEEFTERESWAVAGFKWYRLATSANPDDVSAVQADSESENL